MMSSKSNITRKISFPIYKSGKQKKLGGHKHVQKLGNKLITKNVATPKTDVLFQDKNLTEPMKDSVKEIFQWTKQWYPIHAVMHLDPSRPTGIQLLGKDLVIWHDVDGNWVCFEDQCPHRLVPLSEGRLETDGTLQCSYHGWRFNGEGECVKIPQAEPDMEQKLCSNERAHTKVYPTQEKYGLLWIWGESGADAHLQSLQSPPIVPPIFENAIFESKDWYIRDMPYSHETFLENVLDPAHAPVAHHGQDGFDRNSAKPLYTKLESPMHAYKGYKFFKSTEKKKNFEGGDYVQFLPPNVVLYQYPVTENRKAEYSMLLISTPITQGKCRYFNLFAFYGEEGQKIKDKFSKIPKWMTHLRANLFLQQDNVFLFEQDKIIRDKKMPQPVTKAYYTPTISDLGVNELHKWLTMHAQGGVQYAPEMVPQNRTQNISTDTYNNHTKICTFCMGALQNFRKIQIGAWIACAICATCAICSALILPQAQYNVFDVAVQLPPMKVFIFSLFSLVFGMIGNYANKTIPKFYKTEYVHADH